MTAVLVTVINRYLGLSSDSKPSAPNAGSTFGETDTGAEYVYTGSAWAQTVLASVYSPITSVVTAALLKDSPGNLFKVHITNVNAAIRYLQLHNKATIPLAGESPQRSWIIPAGTATAPGYFELPFVYGDAYATGIGFAISTTQETFTDSATASEHTKTIEYK